MSKEKKAIIMVQNYQLGAEKLFKHLLYRMTVKDDLHDKRDNEHKDGSITSDQTV